MIRAVFGPDPLDDPLVAGWDAIVEDDRAVPDATDPADMALMRRFHSMEEPVSLSPHFFQNLEQLLAEISPTPAAPRWWAIAVVPTVAAGPVPAEGSLVSGRTWRRILPRSSTSRAIAIRLRSIRWTGRWVPAWGAVAALAIMLVASLLVLYHAVPGPSEPPPIPAAIVAPAKLEPLVQFDFTPRMWGMPDGTTWTLMNFSIIELAPGKSFNSDADWYTSAQGPLLLMVLSGELSMQPNGPALLYPDVQQREPPVEVAPGKAVAMEANQAIAYSIADTGAGTNPGSDPMIALIGLAVKGDDSIYPSVPLTDVHILAQNYKAGMLKLSTRGASVSIQRLQLAPFDSFVFDPDSNSRYLPTFEVLKVWGLFLYDGAMDGVPTNDEGQRVYNSWSLNSLGPGPHTFFNLGEKTIEFYFFVVEEAPSTTP